MWLSFKAVRSKFGNWDGFCGLYALFKSLLNLDVIKRWSESFLVPAYDLASVSVDLSVWGMPM